MQQSQHPANRDITKKGKVKTRKIIKDLTVSDRVSKDAKLLHFFFDHPNNLSLHVLYYLKKKFIVSEK